MDMIVIPEEEHLLLVLRTVSRCSSVQKLNFQLYLFWKVEETSP